MTAWLPYAMQRRGGALLNQQCWLWGQDIRRTEGNLLVELGFQRTPVPAGQQGCTQYTRLQPGSELRLWGFGLYYREATGVYLNRYSFAPLFALLRQDVWTAAAFDRLPPQGELASVAAALRTIAALEQDLQRAAGMRYRIRCMAGWKKRSVPPQTLVGAWLGLAGDVEAAANRLAGAGCKAHTKNACRQPLPWAAGTSA